MQFQRFCKSFNETGLHADPASGEITIRPLSASDREIVRRFFSDLSDYARYQRFMGPKQQISENLLKLLSDTDQKSHIAYLASVGSPGRELMIAEARYVADEKNPAAGEMAIAVADEWQGKGIATRMLQLLERQAARNGIRRLDCTTLRTNRGMKQLAERSGYRITANCAEPRAIRFAKSFEALFSIH